VLLSVSGLTGSSFTVQDSLGDQLTISKNGSFSFPAKLPTGGQYAVSIVTQPLSPPQFCSAASGAGTVGSSNPSVAISCLTTALTPRQIDLSAAQSSIVPDRSRHRIYMGAFDRNEVVVLDGDSYLVLDHYFVGSVPLPMALSSDAANLYVGLSEGGAVVIDNLVTQTMTTVPVATQMGTSFIHSLIELRPGVLLIGAAGAGTGGGPSSGVGNLITLDTANGNAMQNVGTGLTIADATALVKSADGHTVYGLGIGYRPAQGAAQELLFSLDATKPSLPLLASVPVDYAQSLAVSQDGKRLLADNSAVFDATTLRRLVAGDAATGAAAETPDYGVIMQTENSATLELYNPDSLAPMVRFTDDCPSGNVTSLTSSQARGEWMIGAPGGLCIVSTTNPTVAPGAPGSRALPPTTPTPVFVPWAEVADGAVNSAVIDSARGVAYVANGFGQSVDIFSLAQQSVIGSIPVAGKPGIVRLSSDGTTLYAGLFDTGDLVSINRTTQSVTGSVNLAAALGTANIFAIAELSPGHVLVGSIPSQDGVGPNTYLVDVVLSQLGSAHRVGCATGYEGALPNVSPDGHYLYMLSASTCPPEKRDLTQSGYPVVVSGPAGAYAPGGGPVAFTPDGAHLISGGAVIDTSTMQQIASVSGGIALASSNPDHYYLVENQTVTVVELHDLKILSIQQNGCQSVIDYGVTDATISADEKTVISLAGGFDLCITQITP
jgi:hypothetical protein